MAAVDEEEDPLTYYSHEIAEPEGDDVYEDDPPIVEYFDKKGENVTPNPLHKIEDDQEERVRKCITIYHKFGTT